MSSTRAGSARHRIAAKNKLRKQRETYSDISPESSSDEGSSVPLRRRKPAKNTQIESEFEDAYRDYIRVLSTTAWEPALFAAGSGVAEKVKRCFDENRIPEEKLTQIVTAARILLRDRQHSDSREYKTTLNKFHRLSKSVGSFPWGKILAGIMLTLIGALILVASGLVIAVALGFFPPITVIFGITLTASVLNTGISAATGVAGIASMVSAGMLFFKAGTPSHLRSHMNRFESELKNPTPTSAA